MYIGEAKKYIEGQIKRDLGTPSSIEINGVRISGLGVTIAIKPTAMVKGDDIDYTYFGYNNTTIIQCKNGYRLLNGEL